MKISEALMNADDEQIAELWDVFVDQARAILNAHIYLENLPFAHYEPSSPVSLDLDGLCEYMKALREYQIAKSYYENEVKRAERAKLDALKNIKVLVYGVWVQVDTYGIRFGRTTYDGRETPYLPNYQIVTWDSIGDLETAI